MRFLASAALLAALACGAQAAEIDPRFAKDDQIREVLSEAVKQYRAGRFEAAAAQFRAAIELDPSNQLLYDFYLRVGPQGLLQMQQREELVDIIDRVLGRARIYQAQLRQSREFHEKLVQKLQGSEEERLVATYELVAAGPRAVPVLIERLADTRQDELRVWVRVALTQMGYRAVRPLIAALSSADARLVETLATILTDIADTRALPQLAYLAQAHESETVRRVAANGVAGITKAAGIAQVEDVPVLYFAEALRYFRDETSVRDELVANDGLLWRWDASANNVVSSTAPSYAWNELVAEDLLFEAAQRFPERAGSYQPLLCAVLTAQVVEADQRSALAKEQVMTAENPAETLEAVSARNQALSEMLDRVAMGGVEALCQAINHAIVAERYNVATAIMRVLADPWLSWPRNILPLREAGLSADKPGSILIAALDHAEKSVRYQAAITLAQLDPGMDFFGADKVVPLLAEAVGEWGMRVALLVDPDFRYRNAAVRELQQKGFLVVAAQDGFEAMARLREAPIKDAIIIAGDLTPAVRDSHGQIIDVPEQTAPTLVAKIQSMPRLGQVPIFVAVPEAADLAVSVQNAFNGKVTGFVSKPYSGSQMADAIDAALGDADLPEFNRDTREAISLGAAQALAGVDPAHTQYPVQDQALLDSLAATLVARSDDIRIAALTALGRFGAQQYAERIAEIYLDQDAELRVPVRVAFITAIGRLDPNNEAAQKIITEALKHPERSVRSAAAVAAGAARSLDAKTRQMWQVQQRLDVREAGNGLSN